MTFSELAEITEGEIVQLAQDRPVSILLTDSRKPIVQQGSVFFAISGDRHDGHDYIRPLYEAGVYQFVVERSYPLKNFPMANVLHVQSSVQALQRIASHHRQEFNIPIIAVTGSNGKTIIKEWLYQLLSQDCSVVKNPASYNSQIGVPLSVWQIQHHHKLGIFEAGISKVGEMQNLQSVLKPTIGIFTNIGTAHDENFSGREIKIDEKLKLFSEVQKLIYCADHRDIDAAVKASKLPSLSWGVNPKSDIIVRVDGNSIRLNWKKKKLNVKVPFADNASVENAIHCIVTMLVLEYNEQIIQQRLATLHSVPMRLESKEAVQQCIVIDDTYNNDLGGLRISIDFLHNQKQRERHVIILSDILESGLHPAELTSQVAQLVNGSGATRFIGIGPVMFQNKEYFTVPSEFFSSTEEFLEKIDRKSFFNEVILVKGARVFQFERIVKSLQKKIHGTVMEVNLDALVHNLNYFRSKLNPGTKLMVMVKAFAYGSGSIEIANLLQFHQVNYLGVAYADEGVELRSHNITIPIMVMNPTPDSFQTMVDFNLEPEIYSFRMLNELVSFLRGRKIGIHLKIDTGMHRLGFDGDDIEGVIDFLKTHPNIQVISMFSHLSGSDESVHDDFSREQASRFKENADKISSDLSIRPMLHLLNTPGILRFPEFQFDMVRLGIGLYGVDPTSEMNEIRPVATLKTVISQIRKVRKGESIGYSRKGLADQDITIATIAIGYADGFSRAFSRGVGEVLIHGKRAPVVGNVCMDMTMVDISRIDAEEGDEVIIFGDKLSLNEVATKIHTIPYEILTNTSERVKRVFVAEGI